MRKKNRAGEIRLPNFRLYYKTAVIKTVWYWHKNRNLDQCNRTENAEISPCTYGQLIYDKGGESIYNVAKTVSPWRRNSNPFQYSYLEIPMERGAWGATSHRVAQSWTWLNQLNSSKDSIFHKWCLENWIVTCKKKIELDHSLTPYTKISSKWIKDLNVRPSTIKILQENIGRTLSDITHGNTFLDPSPRIMEMKIKQTNIPS